MRRHGRARTFLTASTLLIGSWALTKQVPERPRIILQQRLGLSRSEVGALERGLSFAKTLRVGDRREIAAGGAIRVDVPLEFFLQRFADIVSFKQSPIVRQIGKFSDPPRRTDLEGLTFEAADLDSLKTCRAGDCDIQLSGEQIQQIQTGIDWSRTDARMQANRVLRGILFDYVERYRNSDGQALLAYANERTSLRVSDELRMLVTHSSQIVAGLPAFVDSLLYGKPLEGTEEFIYWSKEQFGLKPVVSITHVTIYSPRRADLPDVMIASKQIYASRYLAASLAITLGVAPSAGPSSSFYMVYANRTRPRAFPPLVGGLVRRIAQGQTREGLEEQLALAKVRLESAYRSTALRQ